MTSYVSNIGTFLFPPITTPEKCTEEKETKSLKEKVKANWREIPAIVAVAVCIIGLILSIAWNYTHLSIVFGAGIGCSGFTYFYLSHQVHHLKSMKGYLGDFNKENRELQTQNATLAKTSETIQKQAATFQEENLTLKSSIEQLQGLYTILDNFYQKFHDEGTQSQKQFETNLGQLAESLETLQGDHTSAAKTAELLQTILTSLSENLQFEKLKQMWEENAKIHHEIGQLGQQRKDFQTWIDQFKPVVEGLVATLKAENDKLAANTTKVEGAAEIMEKVGPLLSAFNTLFSNFLGSTYLTSAQSPFPVKRANEVAVF